MLLRLGQSRWRIKWLHYGKRQSYNTWCSSPPCSRRRCNPGPQVAFCRHTFSGHCRSPICLPCVPGMVNTHGRCVHMMSEGKEPSRSWTILDFGSLWHRFRSGVSSGVSSEMSMAASASRSPMRLPPLVHCHPDQVVHCRLRRIH